MTLSPSSEEVQEAHPIAMELDELLRKVRDLAVEYYRLTDKPLGVTDEIAEYEAARLLGLKLCGAREPGCDALRELSDGRLERLQIKGRRLNGRPKPGERVGRIDFKHDWDAVVLVLLDAQFSPVAICEAPREKLMAVLQRPGSKARTERGQMSVSQFKAVARPVWQRPR